MQEHQHWDIIGDIHGHAGQLQDLLAAMGYERKFGSYFHQGGRKALFLGDYIDRGPKIRETLQIVRQMVDSGNALAVMGNHEFNALAYATPDGSGGWLRAHTPDKVAQHVQTQVQIAEPYPDEWRDWLEWFATLPLFLDLGGIRAVHAAWCDESTETFSKVRNLDTQTLHHIMDRQSALYAKRERLLNGVEISLPDGHSFADKPGSRGVQTYRDAVFPESDAVPPLAIPEDQPGMAPYSQDAPPVFFGHYWLPPALPRSPLKPNLACLDYSVAKGGLLTAYRWDGEQILVPEKFVTAGEPAPEP